MSIAKLRLSFALFCVTLVALSAHAEPNSEFLKKVLAKKYGISAREFLQAEAEMKAGLADDLSGFCSKFLTGVFSSNYGAVEVYVEHLAGPKTEERLKYGRVEVQVENPKARGPYGLSRIRAYIPTVMLLENETITEKIEFDVIALIPKTGLSSQQKAAQFALAEERILEVKADLETFMANKWPGHTQPFTISSSSIRGPYWRMHTLTLAPELNDPEVALSLIKYLGSR